MNISITQLVVLTTTLLIASGCDSSSDDSSMPMTNTDAGSTDMTRMEGVDMGTEPQTPEDLDEGEPQPYEYPSSLDTATNRRMKLKTVLPTSCRESGDGSSTELVDQLPGREHNFA